jgi:DNA-binding MarR family transcriptional regulator
VAGSSASATEDAPEHAAHRAIEVHGRLCAVYASRRQQLAQSVGLTEQQWEVLEEINTEHFMPSLFARRRESSAAAVSKIIRQLIDKGLVRVTVSRADGRQRNYVLSAGGKRAIAGLRDARQDAIEKVWLHVKPESLFEFSRVAEELAARLELYARGIETKEKDDGKDAV